MMRCCFVVVALCVFRLRAVVLCLLYDSLVVALMCFGVVFVSLCVCVCVRCWFVVSTVCCVLLALCDVCFVS